MKFDQPKPFHKPELRNNDGRLHNPEQIWDKADKWGCSLRNESSEYTYKDGYEPDCSIYERALWKKFDASEYFKESKL